MSAGRILRLAAAMGAAAPVLRVQHLRPAGQWNANVTDADAEDGWSVSAYGDTPDAAVSALVAALGVDAEAEAVKLEAKAAGVRRELT